MKEKLGRGMGWGRSGTRCVRRVAASLATCVAATGFFAPSLRADHPGHGGHDGLLGGIYHNLVEIGLVVLLATIVAVLVREARRRAH